MKGRVSGKAKTRRMEPLQWALTFSACFPCNSFWDEKARNVYLPYESPPGEGGVGGGGKRRKPTEAGKAAVRSTSFPFLAIARLGRTVGRRESSV